MEYVLRPARPAEDAAPALDVYAPYVRDTAVTFETQAPSAEAFRGRMEGVMKQFPWIVCEDGGRIVGYAYASPQRERAAYRWNAELSVYVAQDACGRGVATRLFGALFDLLSLQGYYTLYSCITLPGETSVALHRKFDFRRVGLFEKAGFKLGRWHDVAWMARPLREYDAPGGIPAAFGTLDAGEVRQILQKHSIL